MTDYVRVRDTELKRHLTLGRAWAKADPDRYEILANHDAVDANGAPLPPKFDVADEPTDKPTEADKPTPKTAAPKGK